MEEFALTKELLLILSPLVTLHVSLVVYCCIIIFKEGVKNLNRGIWMFVCLFINVIGPVVFLLAGRKELE